MGTGVKSIGKRLKILGYSNYKEYLASDHWKNLRSRYFRESRVPRKMLKRYGMLVCDFCKVSAKLNLHHWTYKRLGAEYLGDLMLICEPCHLRIHNMNKNNPRGGLHRASYKVRRLIIKKNGWNPNQHIRQEVVPINKYAH